MEIAKIDADDQPIMKRWAFSSVASGRRIAGSKAASGLPSRTRSTQSGLANAPRASEMRSASPFARNAAARSDEHTSELQSLMRLSYAVFCLKKKKHNTRDNDTD